MLPGEGGRAAIEAAPGPAVVLAYVPPPRGVRRRHRWRRVLVSTLAAGTLAAASAAAAAGLASLLRHLDKLGEGNRSLASRTAELALAKEELQRALSELTLRQAALAEEKAALATRVAALSSSQADIAARNAALQESQVALQDEAARLRRDLRDAAERLGEAELAQRREETQRRAAEAAAAADSAAERRREDAYAQQALQQAQAHQAAAAAQQQQAGKAGRSGDLTVQLVIPDFTQTLLHQATEREMHTQLAKALVTEAKSSALLPSLVEGLAARGVSRLGDVILPWRWFGRGIEEASSGGSDRGTAGGSKTPKK